MQYSRRCVTFRNVNEFGEASMREHSNKTFLFPTTQMILSSSSMVSETR
jgi:hypothetical protein